MFMRRKLACSFCGKAAADVSKLVAGPRVYICDVCAAEAHRIMSDPGNGESSSHSRARAGFWHRLRAWSRRLGNSRNSTRVPRLTVAERAI